MDAVTESAAFVASEPKGDTLRLWLGRGALLVAPLLPFVVFAPALFGRILLAPDDGYLYYLPIHELAAEGWRSGHIPSWNPFQLSGAPLLATQAGAFYPLNVLFLLLPAVYANNVYIILNIAIGALGASLLARRLTGDNAAAVVAGLAFSSSGFVYGHIAHQPVLAGAVWMPWVVLGYDRLTERQSAGRFLLAGLPLGMAGLTGHAQMFFLTILVVAVYGLAAPALADTRRRERLKMFLLTVSVAAVIELLLPTSAWVLVFFMLFFGLALGLGAASSVKSWIVGRRRRLSSWVWLVPSVAFIGGGVAAVQLIPTASLVHETIRSQAGISLATSFSFSPSHLVLLLFPYLFGNSHPVAPFSALYRGDWNLTELAGYPGLAAIVLAAAGSSRIRREPRALALGIAGLVALALALGRSTGLGGLLSFTPVYGQLRAWGRYSVVIDLTVAIFAAYGMAHLRSAVAKDLLRARAFAWAAFAAMAIIAVVVPLLPGVRHLVIGGDQRLLAIVIPLAAAALAATCTFLIGRFDRVALGLCCLVVALDGALSFGVFFEWRHSPSPASVRKLYSANQPTPWGSLPTRSDQISRYIFVGKLSQAMNPYFPQVTDLKGIRSASGYEPLLGRRYADVVGGMVESGWVHRPEQFLGRRSSVLDLLRVSMVFVPKSQAPEHRPSWFRSSSSFGELVRYTYAPRLPSAFLIGKVRRVNSTEAVSAAVGRTGFDPRRSAFIEGTCAPCSTMNVAGFAGDVTHLKWHASTVDLVVEATRPALLVVSQAWFPGWSASIDGHKIKAIRADAIVLGVPVPAGRHKVILSYYPPGLTTGALVSGFTIAGFGLMPLFFYTRQRRRSRRGDNVRRHLGSC
jgi:hypothetical protein